MGYMTHKIEQIDDTIDKVESGFGLFRGSTIKIVAADSTAKSRLSADYVCDGVEDEVQIQVTFAELGAVGGSVELSEGTFTLSTMQSLPNMKVLIKGQGKGITYITNPNGGALKFVYGDNVAFANLSIVGGGQAFTALGTGILHFNSVEITGIAGLDIRATSELANIEVFINDCLLANTGDNKSLIVHEFNKFHAANSIFGNIKIYPNTTCDFINCSADKLILVNGAAAPSYYNFGIGTIVEITE